MLDEQAALPRVLAAIRSDGYEELYAYGPEGLHVQRSITGTTDTLSYALLDAQGSLTQLTDSTGALTLTRVYDAWGNLRFQSGSGSSRLGSTGEWQDGSLVYLRARWYHTGLGSFTTRDSYPGTPERSASLHRYLYTEGNPVNYSDPSGMCVPKGNFFGEEGCHWIWETGSGPTWEDGKQWIGNVFQNIGLPGAIAGDAINTVLGHPTAMAEEILSRDATAAIVGGLFRDLATGGSGRLPQLSTFVAGWSYAKGLERLVCGQPVDPLGFAANTLVLVVGIKGGATNLTIPSMPTGVQTILGPGGSAALRVTATQAYAVVIPTAKLAGAVAGQPGVLVLMAQEGQGSSGGGGSGKEVVALGLNSVHGNDSLLRDFARSVGGKTADEWARLGGNAPTFPDEFIAKLSDSKTNIAFNLTGANQKMLDIPEMLQAGKALEDSGFENFFRSQRITAWELHTIQRHPEWWDRITWYLNGSQVEAPIQFRK